MGVNYIIIHAWEYDQLHNARYTAENNLVSSGAVIKSELDNNNQVQFVYSTDKDYVYKIK